MMKILYTIIILFCSFNVLAQTESETIDFILQKSNQLGFGECDYDYVLKKQCRKVNSLEIKDGYLIIKQEMFAKKIFIYFIELSKIKSILLTENEHMNFTSNYIISKKLVKKSDLLCKKQMKIFFNYGLKDENRFFLTFDENILYTELLPAKDKSNWPKYDFNIGIGITNYNEEIFLKFKNAFEYLVKLNGGKIIDDLF